MSHPYDNGRSLARRRRRQRSTAIAGVVALIVFGGAAYSIFYFTDSMPGNDPAPTCTVTAPPAPQQAVELNVYNASGEKGQASSVAEAMQSRDFDVAVVSNDPYKEELKGVGQIRFGPSGKAFATQYVKPLAPKATMVEDGRTDSSVDLVLGKAFPHLKKAPETSQPAEPGC